MERLRWFLISGHFDRLMLVVIAILLAWLILETREVRSATEWVSRDQCGSRYDPCHVTGRVGVDR